VRRDCELDRNWLQGPMGAAGLYAGGLSLCPCLWFLVLVALPLSLATWLLARGDAAKMRAGLMDPRGEPAAARAREDAALGLFCASLTAVLWGGLLVLVMNGP
jgi:hypothetical protein